jgi:hypothetical protein
MVCTIPTTVPLNRERYLTYMVSHGVSERPLTFYFQKMSGQQHADVSTK